METFIEIIKAIIFGLVEGITEWLPISSTGHMIVLEQFFGFSNTQGKAFFDLFVVIIQLGAIIAVVISFFKELWPFSHRKTRAQNREIWNTWAKILIASIPAGVIGLLFDDALNDALYNYLTVAITLIVYGIIFIVIELFLRQRAVYIRQRYHLNVESSTTHPDDFNESHYTNYPLFNIRSIKQVSYQMALIIGLAQMLALIPGTSRSGVTICAALLMSFDRKTAAKFSFYLSIPAMFGGSIIKSLIFAKNAFIDNSVAPLNGFQFLLIIIASIVAFAVSFVVIRFFMKMLRTKTFMSFGVYRIILGIALLLIFFVVNHGDIRAGIEAISTSDAMINLEQTFVANIHCLNN